MTAKDGFSLPLHQMPDIAESNVNPKTVKQPADDASAHSKPCTICSRPRDVLIRCQISEDGAWHFVCPGKCWSEVSGGAIDGDVDHPYYRYGGSWKNKHAGVSAKRKGKKQKRQNAAEQWQAPQGEEGDENHFARRYTTNDKVRWLEKTWTCRRSHWSAEDKRPGKGWTFWKEVD